MDKKQIVEAIGKLRATAPKRKFAQSFDVIINLKNVDLKKENERILTFLKLPFPRGKKVSVTALVGKELSTKAKEVCDTVIIKEDFQSTDKKVIKNLASKTGFFIAQANIMPDVAKAFGRILGTRGLMPNPKAGCVIPPTAEVKPVVESLQKTVRLETRNEKVVKTVCGVESMKDEEIAENAFAVYNTIMHALPQEQNSIKNVMLKLTMSKPIIVGAKEEPKKEVKPTEKPVEKKEAPKEEAKEAKKEAKKPAPKKK